MFRALKNTKKNRVLDEKTWCLVLSTFAKNALNISTLFFTGSFLMPETYSRERLVLQKSQNARKFTLL